MTRDQITEIFVKVDDFCIQYAQYIDELKKLQAPGAINTRNRASRLCESEVITIMIGFHLGAHRTFKQYYTQIIATHYRELFPGLVSYNRFLELRQKASVAFMVFVTQQCIGRCSGINFIDSTALRVCHNRRIHAHRTFRGLAEGGKTSMGWFYGFKLHLIVNEKGTCSPST